MHYLFKLYIKVVVFTIYFGITHIVLLFMFYFIQFLNFFLFVLLLSMENRFDIFRQLAISIFVFVWIIYNNIIL